MALKEKVAESYRGFICIEDILHRIAEKYQCSLGEASLVLHKALSLTILQGEPGLYETGELGPRYVNPSTWYELRHVLGKKRLDSPVRTAYQKYLCRRDEISRILRSADFPIDETPPPQDDLKGEDAGDEADDTLDELTRVRDELTRVCDELTRVREMAGLLAEYAISERGPAYRHTHDGRPNASRIAEDLRKHVPEDVTRMGIRKLREFLSTVDKAWEAKKRR
jgi:hypothetical protein